jgi:hypothetical protein
MNAPVKEFTTPNYALYERMKADWLQQHPDATYQEIEAAVRQFAEECGV